VNLDEVKFFFLFRDWANLEFYFSRWSAFRQNLIRPARCLISHVFSHGRYTIPSSPSPVALLFMALSVTNYVFSGVDLFSSATKQWALFIYFLFFTFLSFLFLLCKKIRPSSLTSPLIIFRFRSLESLVCAGWPAVVGSVLFISS
jgi:hypothetical protein